MNIIDILGSILRSSPAGQADGGKVLSDILGDGAEDPTAATAPPSSSDPPGVLDQWRREARTPSTPTRPSANPGWNQGEGGLLGKPAPAPPPKGEEEAVYLIRALINSARADGEMDREEEQKILKHLGQPTPDVIAFIRAEFEKPLDVREFAWSVPLGLEEKVYALSLAVMKADSREESSYLKDLAHGLRLSPDICRQIQLRYGIRIPA